MKAMRNRSKKLPEVRKHPDAVARDEFFQRGKGARLCEGSATGQYLLNRLELAFLAGAEHGRQSAFDALRRAAQHHL
jgi:hypothetical protein